MCIAALDMTEMFHVSSSTLEYSPLILTFIRLIYSTLNPNYQKRVQFDNDAIRCSKSPSQ